jgi:predicted SnoaL-like aldol condensation-catalyzing enzyme
LREEIELIRKTYTIRISSAKLYFSELVFINNLLKFNAMKILMFGIITAILLLCGFSQNSSTNNSDCEKILLTQSNNKKLVAEFYQKLFGDKNIDAIDEYIGDVYIQHNPMAADGKDALKELLKKWFVNAPKEKIDIQHLGADGDFVYIHLRTKMGTKTFSVIDIFRLKDNKIIEHWDVIQEVPEKSANDHPMF